MAANVQQQVIGAAAQDPRVQAAAKEAAADPRVQQAAWNATANAARQAANQSAEQARAGFLEIRTYVQESHCGVKVWCFCVALALFVSSILGVVNVFDAVFRPHQYLWAAYNVVFAGIIIIIEGKAEWFEKLWNIQSKLFHKASFLAGPFGRALFYFYVGSINLFMLPDTFLWKIIYIAIGAALCSVSALMLLQSCSSRCQGHARMEGP
mmetsp:Transcript_65904/g.212585  ORF Transcript_65904/g.212585 Transcript_65904/m.212585 type:complete len:209 (-) Transcript_65904:122-748(-)